MELCEGEWMPNTLHAFVSLSTCLFTFALCFLVFRLNKCEMILNNGDSFQFSCTLTGKLNNMDRDLYKETKGKRVCAGNVPAQFPVLYQNSLQQTSPRRKKGCDRKNNLNRSRQDLLKPFSKNLLRIRKIKTNKTFFVCLLPRT